MIIGTNGIFLNKDLDQYKDELNLLLNKMIEKKYPRYPIEIFSNFIKTGQGVYQNGNKR